MGEVKFEAGQRWLTETLRVVLTRRIYGGCPAWLDENGSLWVEEYLTRCGRLEAPAPKPHQRWESTGRVAVQIVDADGELVAKEWASGEPMCRGGLLDVADWLTEFDFKCVAEQCIACVEVENTGGACGPHSCGRTNAEIALGNADVTCAEVRERIHEAVAALGVNEFAKDRSGSGNELAFIIKTAAPVPPSRFAPVPIATSRRLVDEAVKTLRDEPFAKAIQAVLISLCGDRIQFGPRQVDIEAAINACQAWEYARGKVAPGKRSLSAAERRELTETAKIAAWGAGISMPDASDIGEIVGETYERARATC